MINKKIASELAVGIVLLIALAVGGIFWLQDKKEDVDNDEINVPRLSVKSTPKEMVVYALNHKATLSGYDRTKFGTPNDVYSEIFILDPETKEQRLLFSDRDKPFLFELGYSSPRFIESNKILFRVQDRITNNSEYKLLDIKSLDILSLPQLPLPEGYNLDPSKINMLSDGGFVYVAGSEFESAIFICNKDLTDMKKIFSTRDHDSAAINSVSISRDDSKIAFSIGADGVGQGYVEENIYVIDMDGNDLKKIFDKKFTIGNVIGWLPDNEHFIFINSMFNDSSGKLSVVSMDGTIEAIRNSGTYLKVSLEGSRVLSNMYSPENDTASWYGTSSLIVSDLKGEKSESVIAVNTRDGVSVDSIGWIID